MEPEIVDTPEEVLRSFARAKIEMDPLTVRRLAARSALRERNLLVGRRGRPSFMLLEIVELNGTVTFDSFAYQGMHQPKVGSFVQMHPSPTGRIERPLSEQLRECQRQALKDAQDFLRASREDD